MRFFRSEEHAKRSQTSDSFDTITLAQAAQLARAWYVKKLTPGWRRRTAQEAEAGAARSAGSTASAQVAACSRRWSSPGAATSCNPSGKRCSPNPVGITIAGAPVSDQREQNC